MLSIIVSTMGVICGGDRGTNPPTFYLGGTTYQLSPPLFSSKFYITYAGNEAINNIMKYILNTNKYKIIK